uniref:GON-4-like protein n=1 Tax=Myxine glutinosa TaxID=7769 RepID=UPI00358EE453
MSPRSPRGSREQLTARPSKEEPKNKEEVVEETEKNEREPASLIADTQIIPTQRTKHISVCVVPMGPPPPPPSQPRLPAGDSAFMDKLNAVDAELVSESSSLSFQPLQDADGSNSEENLIASRTRSKRPLRDMPLGVLEAALQPPDITPDMYEGTALGDEQWQFWLHGLMDDDAGVDDDDDEDDPEYNFLEDYDEPDKEDFRTDKAVQITKKEVNGLMEELFEAFGEDVECPDVDIAMLEEEGSDDNAASFNTPATIRFQEPLVHLLKDCHKTVRGELDMRARCAHTHKKNPVCSFILDEAEKIQLQQQMQQHVQLLAQMYLLVAWHPKLHDEAELSKTFLEELSHFAKVSQMSYQSKVPGFRTTFQACNLEDAVSLLRNYTEELQKSEHNIYTGYSFRKLGKAGPLAHRTAMTIASSSVFMYPELLPTRMLKPASKKQKTFFTKGEDNLLALGLKHFEGSSNPKALISQYLMSFKSPQQIYIRIKNAMARQAEDNAIKLYKNTKTLPPMPKLCKDVLPEEAMAPLNMDSLHLPDWLQDIIERERLQLNRREEAKSKLKKKAIQQRKSFAWLCPKTLPFPVSGITGPLEESISVLGQVPVVTAVPQVLLVDTMPTLISTAVSNQSENVSAQQTVESNVADAVLPIVGLGQQVLCCLSTKRPLNNGPLQGAGAMQEVLQSSSALENSSNDQLNCKGDGNVQLSPVAALSIPCNVEGASFRGQVDLCESPQPLDKAIKNKAVITSDLNSPAEEQSLHCKNSSDGFPAPENICVNVGGNCSQEDHAIDHQICKDVSEHSEQIEINQSNPIVEDQDEELTQEEFEEEDEEEESSESAYSALSVPELQETIDKLSWLASEQRSALGADSEEEAPSQEDSEQDEEEEEAVGTVEKESSWNEEQVHPTSPSTLEDERLAATLLQKSKKQRVSEVKPRVKRKPKQSRARGVDSAKMLLLLADDLVECDPHREQKDLAFAQLYLSHVQDKLRESPMVYSEFLRILSDFKLAPKQRSVVDMVTKLHKALRNWPDLLQEFAAFLLPEQALECGLLEEQQAFERSRRFLRQLEVCFDENPSYHQKILRALQCCSPLSPNDVNELKTQMCQLLKGQHYLQEEFSLFFEDLRPPSNTHDDFEEVQWLEEHEYQFDGFEEVVLPSMKNEADQTSKHRKKKIKDKEKEKFQVLKGPQQDGNHECSCTRDEANVSYRSSKKCRRRCVLSNAFSEELQGSSTAGMTSAHNKAEGSLRIKDSAEKPTQARRDIHSSNRLGSLKVTDVLEKQEDSCGEQKKEPVLSEDECLEVSQNRVQSGTDAVGNADSSQGCLFSTEEQTLKNRENKEVPAEVNTKDCQMQIVTASKSEFDRKAIDAGSLFGESDVQTFPCLTPSASALPNDSKNGKSNRIQTTCTDNIVCGNESRVICAKNTTVTSTGEVVVLWTREADKIILTTCQESGAHKKTFAHIAGVLQNKTAREVSRRFRELMNLYQRMAENCPLSCGTTCDEEEDEKEIYDEEEEDQEEEEEEEVDDYDDDSEEIEDEDDDDVEDDDEEDKSVSSSPGCVKRWEQEGIEDGMR